MAEEGIEDVASAGAPAGLRATMCRCGASADNPYCDGRLRKVGVRAG